MIAAEFVGGPRDGEVIALEDNRPLRIPIPPDFTKFASERDVPVAMESIKYIELTPQLTRNGWRLYWTERPC